MWLRCPTICKRPITLWNNGVLTCKLILHQVKWYLLFIIYSSSKYKSCFSPIHATFMIGSNYVNAIVNISFSNHMVLIWLITTNTTALNYLVFVIRVSLPHESPGDGNYSPRLNTLLVDIDYRKSCIVCLNLISVDNISIYRC